MPCNAVAYQRASIADEELLKLLPHDALARLANFLRARGYRVTAGAELLVCNDNATARVALNNRSLDIFSPSRKLADSLREELMPALRAIAAQELQRRVAAFVVNNSPTRRVERAANGAVIIHADIRI
jgi:hypothetical protein